MANKTAQDVFGRLVYDYNHVYDEWKKADGAHSLTTALVPVLNEAAIDLLRTANLTLCAPEILGVRRSHIVESLTRDLMRFTGRIDLSKVTWDLTLAKLRSLR